MVRKVILSALFLLPIGAVTSAQEPASWTFNVGGGVGFPLSDTSRFVGNGGHFVVGGGRNFRPALAVDTEFMWLDMPPKRSILNQIGAPDGSARTYALTLNGILRIPTKRRFGAYVIGGGGWYHRSGELTAPAVKPGTICTPFWGWWGVTCVNGLIPVNVVLASRSSDAGGGNIGGGITIPIGEGQTNFYVEVRYHHAAHSDASTDSLPLTFGFRW
jgi:hypothetical protein